MNFLGGQLGNIAHRRDKGFSSKNKVQQYHGDGSESIIVMGRSFRVLQKISDVPPPYMVGRQRALKFGEGGSSYVYLVENTSHLPEFPRHMALKRSFFGVDQVAEAHKEVDIVSRIKDKNIVRTYHSEISRNEGRLGVSIAMEYCSNNLYRRIRSTSGTDAAPRLTEGEICHVMLAVTSAVGYLHTQQPPITHRDIRPENILINNKLTGPAAYKLTNFGNACTEAYRCETREEANMAIADIQMHTNPAFRAPEMADPWGKKRICVKADMWAIGVLLYYMMYLRLPFDPSAAIGQEKWVVNFPPQTIGSYTGSLRVMVEHLLDPNPDTRWDVFALTNFMRFDEDCSRHLGTFCFTKTEWPEGWEEQEVKVFGRSAPAKAPPISYGEPGHEQLDGRGAGRGHSVDANDTDSTGARGYRPTHNLPEGSEESGSATDRHRGGNAGSNGGSHNIDAVQEAMMVLGGDAVDDDSEMAEYRRKIIREQKEAWEQVKAAAGRTAGASSPPQQHQQQRSAAAGGSTTGAASPAASQKDAFADLFSGPSPSPVASPSATVPAAMSHGGPASAESAPKDMFSADDLFSAPPVQAPQQTAMGGWGSGVPAVPGAGYAMPQQQQEQPGDWQYNDSPNTYMPPASQQGYQGGYPTQPQQQSMNFMASASGQQRSAPAPQTGVTSRKDPFADLFS